MFQYFHSILNLPHIKSLCTLVLVTLLCTPFHHAADIIGNSDYILNLFSLSLNCPSVGVSSPRYLLSAYSNLFLLSVELVF